jgi:cytidylate kinase
MPAMNVELANIGVQKDNGIWVRLRLEDGRDIGIEFAPDSAFSHDLLKLVEQRAAERLGTIGQRGMTITGFTEIEGES